MGHTQERLDKSPNQHISGGPSCSGSVPETDLSSFLEESINPENNALFKNYLNEKNFNARSKPYYAVKSYMQYLGPKDFSHTSLENVTDWLLTPSKKDNLPDDAALKEVRNFLLWAAEKGIFRASIYDIKNFKRPVYELKKNVSVQSPHRGEHLEDVLGLADDSNALQTHREPLPEGPLPGGTERLQKKDLLRNARLHFQSIQGNEKIRAAQASFCNFINPGEPSVHNLEEWMTSIIKAQSQHLQGAKEYCKVLAKADLLSQSDNNAIQAVTVKEMRRRQQLLRPPKRTSIRRRNQRVQEFRLCEREHTNQAANMLEAQEPSSSNLTASASLLPVRPVASKSSPATDAAFQPSLEKTLARIQDIVNQNNQKILENYVSVIWRTKSGKKLLFWGNTIFPVLRNFIQYLDPKDFSDADLNDLRKWLSTPNKKGNLPDGPALTAVKELCKFGCLGSNSGVSSKDIAALKHTIIEVQADDQNSALYNFQTQYLSKHYRRGQENFSEYLTEKGFRPSVEAFQNWIATSAAPTDVPGAKQYCSSLVDAKLLSQDAYNAIKALLGSTNQATSSMPQAQEPSSSNLTPSASLRPVRPFARKSSLATGAAFQPSLSVKGFNSLQVSESSAFKRTGEPLMAPGNKRQEKALRNRGSQAAPSMEPSSSNVPASVLPPPARPVANKNPLTNILRRLTTDPRTEGAGNHASGAVNRISTLATDAAFQPSLSAKGFNSLQVSKSSAFSAVSKPTAPTEVLGTENVGSEDITEAQSGVQELTGSTNTAQESEQTVPPPGSNIVRLLDGAAPVPYTQEKSNISREW